jgi:cobalt/nickel transport system permease protein
MNTDPFSTGDSLWHRLDPRFKLILAGLFSIAVASFQRFDSLLCALLVSLALVLMTGLSKKQVFKRAVIANAMSLLLWLVLPFTVKGETMTIRGFLDVSVPGVLLATRLTVKLNTLILALIALVSTSDIPTIGHALYSLKVPGKLIYLLLFTYRYLSVLSQEYQRLSRAARVRCFKPKTNLHTYRIFGYFVGMMLVRAAVRGDHVHRAMLCRGFNGRFFCLYHFKITRSDRLVFLIGIFTVILLGVWEWRMIT